MTNSRRNKIIKILSKEITKYSNKLKVISEMKEDVSQKNGHLLPKVWLPYIDMSKISADYNKYSAIIADLKTIQKAIQNKENSAILSSVDDAGMSPVELCNSLDAAFGSFNYENDGFSNVFYFC